MSCTAQLTPAMAKNRRFPAAKCQIAVRAGLYRNRAQRKRQQPHHNSALPSNRSATKLLPGAILDHADDIRAGKAANCRPN